MHKMRPDKLPQPFNLPDLWEETLKPTAMIIHDVYAPSHQCWTMPEGRIPKIAAKQPVDKYRKLLKHHKIRFWEETLPVRDCPGDLAELIAGERGPDHLATLFYFNK